MMTFLVSGDVLLKGCRKRVQDGLFFRFQRDGFTFQETFSSVSFRAKTGLGVSRRSQPPPQPGRPLAGPSQGFGAGKVVGGVEL